MCKEKDNFILTVQHTKCVNVLDGETELACVYFIFGNKKHKEGVKKKIQLAQNILHGDRPTEADKQRS